MARIMWALLLRERSGAEPAYPGKGTHAEELASALEPTWMTRLPRQDAWGHPLRFVIGTSEFRIESRGPRANDAPLVLTGRGLEGVPTRECGCPGDLLRPRGEHPLDPPGTPRSHQSPAP